MLAEDARERSARTGRQLCAGERQQSNQELDPRLDGGPVRLQVRHVATLPLRDGGNH